MNPLPLLPRRARRYLLERLERLHEALASLARRLRDGIATVIGTHVGDAVRDALQAALDQKTRDASPSEQPDDFPRRYAHADWRDPYEAYPEYPSPSVGEPASLWHDEHPAPSS